MDGPQLGVARPAAIAAGQMVAQPRALGVPQLAVQAGAHGLEGVVALHLGTHHRLSFRGSAAASGSARAVARAVASSARPRATRDRTVPMGQPITSATSA